MSDFQKKGYLLEDFRLFHLRTDQGTRPDFHYHEFCKILLLLSGSGGYVVDSQRYLVQSGDIVLIPSRSVHRPEFESGTPYERIILYISPEFLERQSLPGSDLREVFSGQWGHVLRPGEAERQRLQALAVSLEQEMEGTEFGQAILRNGLLLRLLVEVGRSLHREGAYLPEPIRPRNDRILQIVRYIDAHLVEDLSIDELAERFYLSKYHMMHLFRRETGLTIHGYISERRLMLARDQISRGMSATESCYRSGFRSYCSFTRAYAKRFGTTPTGRTAPVTLPDEIAE